MTDTIDTVQLMSLPSELFCFYFLSLLLPPWVLIVFEQGKMLSEEVYFLDLSLKLSGISDILLCFLF